MRECLTNFSWRSIPSFRKSRHAHLLSESSLLVCNGTLRLAEICHDSGQASLLILIYHIPTLRPHPVKVVCCGLLPIKSDLISYITSDLCKMLQERHNIVQCSIICAAIELRKHDHVVLVERHSFIREIQVNNFFDRSSKIAEVFDIFTILDNGALASQDTLECLHVWVESHGNFFDHPTLLITE